MRRPSPGRILAAVRERVSGARYFFEDLLFVIGRGLLRVLRAIGRGFGAFWAGLGIEARRRLLGALGIAVVLAVLLALAVPNLPCELPGGERCPPDDEAAEIVPATSLAYIHVNVDSETDQYEELADIAGRAPLFAQQIAARALAQLPGPGGAPVDFPAQVEPWFGGEAALAVVPGGESGQQVELLEIEDPGGARRFAGELAAGETTSERYRDRELRIDDRGLATADIEGFLAIGSREAVRAVIDTATGAEGSRSLADDDSAENLRDRLPDHRFVEAYVSPEGARTVVADSPDLLGTLALFLNPGATTGAAAAVAADDGTLELAVRSELDPDRARTAPGFFAAFPGFEAELPERLDANSLAYLGFGEPERTVRALLAQASAEAPGVASGFEAFVDSLRREGEIDIERGLLPALGGEAGFTVEPRPGAGASGAAAPPYLKFVADDVDEDRTRRALAALQGPVVDSIDVGQSIGLQAPGFSEREIGGVEAHTLPVFPGLEVSYSVFDGLAVVATAPQGIERLASGDGGLDEAELFERATEDFEDESSVLAFLDLETLIAQGFEIGLAQIPAFNTFADELRRLEALGLQVRQDDELLSTDARLLVSEAEEPAAQPEDAPLAPPAD